MKHLVDFLNEQLNLEVQTEVNESNEKWYRFTTKDFDDQTVVDNMKSKGESAGFYVENIDGGVKIRVDEDKVNNLNTLVAWLEQFVNGIKDDESKEGLVKKLEKVIEDMKKDMESANKAAEEADKAAKEEEEKAKEEAEKAKADAEKKAAEEADKAAKEAGK